MSYPSKPIENDRLREKLIEILRKPIFPHELADPTEAVADYLLDNDVLPVVRCKDCKNRGDEDSGLYLCLFNGVEWNEGNHFCSYGKRRDRK